MGIEKVHGVILVVEEFVEEISFAAFCCGLCIGRELIEIDETVVVRMDWRRGIEREGVLRWWYGHECTKVRVCRAWRPLLAWVRGGVGRVCGDERRRCRRRRRQEERRKTINVGFAGHPV